MTYDETRNLLRELYKHYPQTKINNAEQWISTYFTVLGEYDVKDIILASRLCLKECSFFPKPADIIKRIRKANLLYDEPVAPVKQIEASTQPYIDERVEYIMEHFCEGGDCGWDGVNYANT